MDNFRKHGVEDEHRLSAALLECDNVPQNQLRVFCGFSPRMYECCWYETNLSTLWRYAKNRFKSLFHDDADIQNVMHDEPSALGFGNEVPEQNAGNRVAGAQPRQVA